MRVVWIYGPPGVGKSVTAWRVYLDLLRKGRGVAYVDIDQLGMVYPARAADPERHRLKGGALAAVAPHYAEAGAEVLVVSGVLDPDLIDWYADQLADDELLFCRLTVDEDELDRRLLRRGVASTDRAAVHRLAIDLDLRRLLHPSVVTAGRTVDAVADEVWRTVETLPPASTRAPLGGGGGPSAQPAVTATSRAVFLCGAQAVGKSSVAWELFSSACRQVTTAYVDTAQVGFVGDPTAPAAHSMRSAMVGALWDCFRAAGATRLVLSGNVDTPDEVTLYRRALADVDLTVVRLRAGPDELVARHVARGQGEGPDLAGDRLVGASAGVLRQAAVASWHQQERPDAAPCADVDFDTGGLTAAAAAAQLSPLLG